MTREEVRNLLRAEIRRVAGCTEPASVAYAFRMARSHLNAPFDPTTARAFLTASSEVLRNASTAVVPRLQRRGLRTAVAAGLAARASRYDLFHSVDRRMADALLRRRGWLASNLKAGAKGVYIKATLEVPGESVTVTIQGRHDEIRHIGRNGRTLFRTSPTRTPSLTMAEIMDVAGKRDPGLEAIARNFLMRQVRGNASRPLPERVAALVRARMLGSPAPIMTIVGSGNHGILLGVPLHDLYRKHGGRMLPAAVFALLTVILLTGRRQRLSEECGLGTKAAPALAAGLAFAQGASLASIIRLMRSVSGALSSLECHGARAGCGAKAKKALAVVLEHLPGINDAFGG